MNWNLFWHHWRTRVSPQLRRICKAVARNKQQAKRPSIFTHARRTMWVDGLENRQLLSAVTPEASLASTALVVDFDSVNIQSYNGTTQDIAGSAVSADSGAQIYQYGNNWKKIALNYNVTSDTVIEFDFKSTTQGEIHGIGFDTDDVLSNNTFIQLYGTQENWGITSVEQYDAEAGQWKHYTIQVGDLFTGNFNFLTFGMDNDIASPNSNSYYANIQIYEDTTDTGDTGDTGDTSGDSGGGEINFEDYTVASYDPNQDITQTYAVSQAGSTLTLSGNTWKQIQVNYTITADTVLEFEYRSTVEGDIQGIGFDNDLALSGDKFFKVFGFQNAQGWANVEYETYTTAQGTVHYTINVGQYFTGYMQYMVFGNDNDVASPTANSTFSNLKLYEPSTDTGDTGDTGDTSGAVLDFDDYTVKAFHAGAQVNNGSATVINDGSTLVLTGNVWRYIELPTNVTAGTVIELDFYSSSQGEVQGIGFDNDLVSSSDLFYKFFGTQTWGIQTYSNYDLGDGWVHYTITLNDIPAGNYQYLVFGNDHDVANPTSNSQYANIQITQPTGGSGGDTGGGSGGDVTDLTGVPDAAVDGVDTIDFSNVNVQSYDSSQDVNGTATVVNDGQVLVLQGNTWKQIALPTTVDTNTYLEFDFYSDSRGEVHGIGFDTDSYLSSDKFFQLFGTQTFGNQDYDTYSLSNGWTHYKIALGDYFTGDVAYLVLGMDHDVSSPDATSYFANVQVYQDTSDTGSGSSGNAATPIDAPAASMDHDVIDFTDLAVTSYGGSSQDVVSVTWVLDDGRTFYLAGNSWKKIDFAYNITESTVLEFDYRSAAEGEVHGIGFDVNDVVSNDFFFQVDGEQNWAQYIIDDYDYADGEEGWVHYAIPVGTYFTGLVSYMTFGMDNDISIPISESYFANVSVYNTASDVIVGTPPVVENGSETIDFSAETITAYSASSQQGNGVAVVEFEGTTLHLTGDTWQKISLPYNINPYTVLEFDYFTAVEGEVSGIGFDTDDNSLTSDEEFFQIDGTQSFGFQDFATYTTDDGWTHYVIPVGDFLEGYSKYLIFANDHDVAGANADVYYANVTLYDDLPAGFESEYNSIYGYGLVDAAAAVADALGVSEIESVAYYGGGYQSALNIINAPEVWDAGITGAGVVVAIIDTGVNLAHSDLNDNAWVNTGEIAGDGIDNDGNGYIDDVNGYNFVDDNANVNDTNGHGTLVAGVVAAENNGVGAIGVAYDAQIMAVRVLDGYGGGDFYSVLDGIYYAVDNGADVINLSLTFDGGHPYLEAALKYAQDRGVVVVMAAGNDSDSEPLYPAQYANKYGIAVGAVTDSGYLTSYTNLAGSVVKDFVVVPGINIYTTALGEGYSTVSASSFATPLVTGVAALLKAANPSLTAKQIESYIALNANPYAVFV